MKCSFCGEEFETDFNICPACGKEQQALSEGEKICPRCNAEVNEDSRFCNKCGWDFETQSIQRKFCPKCGTELEADARFCLKCGHNLIETKRKKKNLIPIVAILIIVLVAGIGTTAYYIHQKTIKEEYEAELAAKQEAEQQRQRLIHSYQSKTIELYNAINQAKTNFDILSTMFDASTELNTGLLGPSFFTSYVEGLCSSEITQEKSRKREIDDIYEELDGIECEENEIQNLKNAIEDYYYAYCDRYDLLVNINFTMSNFSSKESSSKADFNDKFSAVQKEINAIDRNALEEDEDSVERESEGGTTI